MAKGRVAGKVAVVTGGASGIGKAIAAMLVREGARVTITDLDRDAGEEAAAAMGCEFRYQDVAEEDQWAALMEQVTGRHDRLDVLVNNAGTGSGGAPCDPENTTLEAWNRTMAINAGGAFLGCKHAIPPLRASGGGSIINMSSIAAFVSTPFLTAYGASKAAVCQLTVSVAVHCAEQGYGIRCNSVHPGQITTPMHRALIDDFARRSGVSQEAMQTAFLSKIPMKQFGEPDDIAYAVLYLASDEAKHVTGEQMVIDGGMHHYR